MTAATSAPAPTPAGPASLAARWDLPHLFGCGVLGAVLHVWPRAVWPTPAWPTWILILGSLWGAVFALPVAPRGAELRLRLRVALLGWAMVGGCAWAWHFEPGIGFALCTLEQALGLGRSSHLFVAIESRYFVSELAPAFGLLFLALAWLRGAGVLRAALAGLIALVPLVALWLLSSLLYRWLKLHGDLVDYPDRMAFLALVSAFWGASATLPWLVLRPAGSGPIDPIPAPARPS